ncbi:mevalonate kinase [Pseudobdellovibrio exovorus]|uniref:mevalonate kinase family protein n=1 Tax=Pseudobdellovibrio exovorus TaxID=453816 RepID=UPI0006845BDE|nr:hypothetical protein [Pseudobdellovibrio exovorus]
MKNNDALTVDFEVRVPGKWILAGEHAVLRGCEAVVFPLESRYLQLQYSRKDSDLELQISGEKSAELELIIWSVIEKALKLLGLRRSELKGLVDMRSHIALGGGMGASATLCVALTEWLHYLGFVPHENKFSFARDLENLFHGESSGVDVAVTLARKPLVFLRDKGFSEIQIAQMPYLYLSYSGERGVTKDCIEKVKNIFVESPELAISIDRQMQDAVSEFKALLQSKVHSELQNEGTLLNWIKTMRKANNCFEQWGLVTENVKKHQKTLLDAGALAVKLTGSGGGGYVLSLWEKPLTTEPQKTQLANELGSEMIACFPE